jgi:hypothetical protein
MTSRQHQDVAEANPSAETTEKLQPLVDGFDLTELRLTGVGEDVVKTERIISEIPIQKPAKDVFVRTHPDKAFVMHMMTIQTSDGEFYVVSASIQEALQSEPLCQPRAFIPYTTRQGELFIWPIRLPRGDERIDGYNRSAMEHAERARRDWVRVAANRVLSVYDLIVPVANLGEPKWPSMDVATMYGIALKNRVISSLDHPVLKDLRGDV